MKHWYKIGAQYVNFDHVSRVYLGDDASICFADGTETWSFLTPQELIDLHVALTELCNPPIVIPYTKLTPA